MSSLTRHQALAPQTRPSVAGTRRRPLAALAAATLLTLLAACSGNDGGSTDTAALQERLDTAKTAIDDAETIELALSTDSVPDGVSGLLSATGKGNHSPAFEGDVKVSTGGSSLSAEVIAVDGTVYAKTSIAPVFLTIDPASLKAPDPAVLFDPEDGVSSILQQTDDLAEGDRSRDGQDVLTTITGTLPGSVVARILPTADEDAEFEVSYRLDDDDVLRDARMSGPFYGESSSVTYSLSLTTSDEPVEIAAPAATGGS